MNFNVYLKKMTGERIEKIAKDLNRSRNSIISEALEEWLKLHYPSQWPKDFFKFPPIDDVPDFKSYRKELTDVTEEDPLQ